MKDKQIRNNFKLLKQNKIVYFDNAASSLKPTCVINAMDDYYYNLGTNSGRGVYKIGYETTQRYEDARSFVARFIHADAKEIVFTKNATDSLNMVALSYGLQFLKVGDEIVTSELEHHSNYLPWVKVENKTGAKLVNIPLDSNHRITVENFKKVINKNTKVVALTHVSNVMGYMTPIEEIIKIAHEYGAIVVLDVAQSIPHNRIDVKELDCDFLAFSGHKICGPTGIGVLYGKAELLNKIEPVLFGGGMVNLIEGDVITYQDIPHKFEAGTPAIAEAIGLHRALKFIDEIGYDYIERKERQLLTYLEQKLNEIKEVEIYNKNTDSAIISFNIVGIHAHDVASVYDSYNICVRAGHHCAQPLMHHLKQPATVRVSLYFYNTIEEIDKFIFATKKVIEFFNKF